MPAPTFRRGDQIARRYQVVTKSGETSLWVGYHACDQTSQAQSEQKGNMPEPDVLVKVVRPELVAESGARERLVRDLQRMKGLQHPGLPRLMDVQILEELQTVALIEAIQAGLSQGVLLRRMVTFRQKERFSLAEVRQIGAQLASVLSYIHGQMLYHGDLRLETVILRPDGTKLCDIGLGASLPRQTYLEAVRKVNESELIAPEVREGKPVDGRSDVYGLAALYKHLLSLGQGQEWAAVLAEKPAMQGVLDRGMHEDPAQRYGSIEALIADIEAVARTGQPIRKRINMSPVAMAVAAGRLPAEELTRSAEELPESARSRRTGGIFEASRISSSSASARSVRITQVGGEPAGGGEASASSLSKDGPSQVDGARPPSGTSKAGGLPSATSRSPRVGGSGRSVPPPGEPAEPARPESTSTDAAPAAAVSGEVPAAAPAGASAPGAPTAAAATPRPSSEKSSRASRPSRPIREPTAEPASEPPAPATESQEEIRRQRPAPAPRDPTSRRSPQEAAISPRPEGERSDTSPRKSSTSSEERGARPLKLPPGMIVTSKLALAGALILAALVGALVAVVVMLLLRPTVILGPVSPAAVPGAATPAPDRAGVTPVPTPPSVATPIVPTPAPVSATPPAASAPTGDTPAAPTPATDKPPVPVPAPAAATDTPAAPTPPAPVEAPPSPGFPSAPVVPVAPPSGADPGPATPAFPTAPVVPIKTEPATPTPSPTPGVRKGSPPPLRPAQPVHPVAVHPVGKPAPQPVRPQKPGAAPASVAPKALPPKTVRPGPPPRPGAHPAAPTGPQPAPTF